MNPTLAQLRAAEQEAKRRAGINTTAAAPAGDEYDFLAQLVTQVRHNARAAYPVANELRRDRMLSSRVANLLTDIIRDASSIQAIIAQERGKK